MAQGESVDEAPAGLRLIGLSALVMVAYAALGALTLSVGQSAGLASPVWPAAGLAFAAVYAWGWRLMPAVLLGSLLSNTVTLLRQESLSSDALIAAAAVALGAAIQAWFAATIVKGAVGPDAALARGREIVTFLLLAGPVGSLVNASVATVAQVTAGLISFDRAGTVWGLWWAGDAIGTIVFAPLVLMMIPSQDAVWNGRRLRVALPSLVGVLLFAGFFAQSHHQQEVYREAEITAVAQEAAALLEGNVNRHQEVLEGLGSFFESSEEVNADEFATYTASALARYPNVQALSWNPIIPLDEVVDFEAYQRSQQGLDGYTITERDSEGNLIPALERDEYVAVAYIEPRSENEAALGFDINSNAVRRFAIDRARELGLPSATAPIDLVQDSDQQKGMLALAPVYDTGAMNADVPSGADGLRGFVVGVYRLGDLLTGTFSGPAWNEFDIALIDTTVTDSQIPVAMRTAITPEAIDLTSAEPVAFSEEFEVYGRTWLLEVTPTSGSLTRLNSTQALVIDVFGLIILTLLQAFVLLVTGMERQAARHARHFNHQANTDPLTGLSNRRAFLRHLEAVKNRADIEGTASALLFMDLDRFKAVNDEGGHEAGDEMLCAVAGVLTEGVRSRDTVTRVGGDEFAIILNDCQPALALRIAETLAREVDSLRMHRDGRDFSVGVSIGVATITPHRRDGIDDIIRGADEACYRAKRSGGGALAEVESETQGG
jgi:diguanylate cyclase (GGDEF)-like protein